MADPLDIIQRAASDLGAALMGVVNVTPDSFHDGGRYDAPERAAAHIERLLGEGAAVVDIGGESSRPGAPRVPAADQIGRIRSAVAHAVRLGALVSVDTTSAAVAAEALDLGARVVNDVSCLSEPALAREVARVPGAVLLLGHARGTMDRMSGFSAWPDADYDDVVARVADEWARARDAAVDAGVPVGQVWLDPGLGFSKNARQSLEVLARLDALAALAPVLAVGPSRKSFLATEDGSAPAARLGGTIAACLAAVDRGAQLLRVHDVHDVRQALLLRRRLAATRARGEAPRA